MASSMTVFLLAALCVVATHGQSFQSRAIRSVLSPVSDSSILPIYKCQSIGCAESATGSVSFKYGKTDRGGVLTATYNDDGSLGIQTAGSGSQEVTRTTLAVGSDPSCVKNSADAKVEFNQCGFSHATNGTSICREIVVKVRQQFRSAVAGVHFFGGKDVTVRVCLHASPPSTVKLITPVPVGEDTINSCSALDHSLFVLPTPKSNTWSFQVLPSNYQPDLLGVGFQVQKCVLRHFLVDSDTVSQNPEHAITIIDNGKFIGPASQLINQESQAGKSYKVTIRRLAVLGDVEDVDSVDFDRASVVDCSVCLCRLPGIPVSGSDQQLKVCRGHGDSASAEDETDNTSQRIEGSTSGSLQAGSAVVIPDLLPFY